MSRISKDRLRALRNEVDVGVVISKLRIPTRLRGRRLTFRCPLCRRFHTAVSSRADLARCFPCARSFNPIDLVMAERGAVFLEAVRYLEELLLRPDPVVGTRHPDPLNYRDPDLRK